MVRRPAEGTCNQAQSRLALGLVLGSLRHDVYERAECANQTLVICHRWGVRTPQLAASFVLRLGVLASPADLLTTFWNHA